MRLFSVCVADQAFWAKDPSVDTKHALVWVYGWWSHTSSGSAIGKELHVYTASIYRVDDLSIFNVVGPTFTENHCNIKNIMSQVAEQLWWNCVTITSFSWVLVWEAQPNLYRGEHLAQTGIVKARKSVLSCMFLFRKTTAPLELANVPSGPLTRPPAQMLPHPGRSETRRGGDGGHIGFSHVKLTKVYQNCIKVKKTSSPR